MTTEQNEDSEALTDNLLTPDETTPTQRVFQEPEDIGSMEALISYLSAKVAYVQAELEEHVLDTVFDKRVFTDEEKTHIRDLFTEQRVLMELRKKVLLGVEDNDTPET